jgi:hypothetical protein
MGGYEPLTLRLLTARLVYNKRGFSIQKNNNLLGCDVGNYILKKKGKTKAKVSL